MRNILRYCNGEKPVFLKNRLEKYDTDRCTSEAISLSFMRCVSFSCIYFIERSTTSSCCDSLLWSIYNLEYFNKPKKWNNVEVAYKILLLLKPLSRAQYISSKSSKCPLVELLFTALMAVGISNPLAKKEAISPEKWNQYILQGFSSLQPYECASCSGIIKKWSCGTMYFWFLILYQPSPFTQ